MLLHDYVDRWAAQRPDGEFAVQGERRTTWAQARDVSAGAACVLRMAGLAPGDRCAVLARNAIEYVLLYVAASRAGVVLVPLNPRSAVAEWDQVVADAAAMLLVLGPGFDGVALPAMPVVGLDELCAAGRAAAPAPPRHDRAAAPLTGGTTGRPKGASLSQQRRDLGDGADRRRSARRPAGRALAGRRAALARRGHVVGARPDRLGREPGDRREPGSRRAGGRARRAAHRLRGAGPGPARADGRRARRRGPRLPRAAPAAHRLRPRDRADAPPGGRRVPLRARAGLRPDRDRRGRVDDDAGRHRTRPLRPSRAAGLGRPGAARHADPGRRRRAAGRCRRAPTARSWCAARS